MNQGIVTLTATLGELVIFFCLLRKHLVPEINSDNCLDLIFVASLCEKAIFVSICKLCHICNQENHAGHPNSRKPPKYRTLNPSPVVAFSQPHFCKVDCGPSLEKKFPLLFHYQ